MTVENLTLLFTIINSTFIALLFIFIKFGIEKRLKKYEYSIGDASELNKKMHDRLVDVEDCVNTLKPIPKETQKRLRMTASRLQKHNQSIPNEVDSLINTWDEAFFSVSEGAVNITTYANKQMKCLELIKAIKTKVDKIVT